MTGRLRQGRRVLLVVEDDPDTANLLSMYFDGHHYDVGVAARGNEAVQAARRTLPDIVLLDIGLPDLDGYAVCEALRGSPRTQHIPIVFLTERSGLADRVAGLSAGAQDYVTKPFDLEELRLRVQNLISRTVRENLVDPRTSLPTGPWVEEQRRRAMAQPGWHSLECRVESFQPFVDHNGFVAGDDVLKFTAHLLREVTDGLGTPDDFIGHPANTAFLVVTGAPDVAALIEHLRTRFDAEVKAHYSFMDREQGYLQMGNQDGQALRAPLMTLRVNEAGAA